MHSFDVARARLGGLLLHCLTVLRLGFACILLLLHQVVGTLCCLGLARLRSNAIAGRSRPYRRRDGTFVLALLDILLAPGGTLLAFGFVPHRLALAQHGLRIACTAPRITQAIFHGKALIAACLRLPRRRPVDRRR